MGGRIVGVVLLGCVLGATGCRKEELKGEPERAQVAAPAERPQVAQAPVPVQQPKPEAAPVPEAAPQTPAPGVVLQESATMTRKPGSAARPGGRSMDDEDRIWLSETAEAARAGNSNIAPDMALEEVPIASGTVDGRVKRVHARAIEVSDGEGNIYELRIDNRSRGLRRGRQVPLRRIAEGTPVRASFDLLGGGDSLARDIVLRH